MHGNSRVVDQVDARRDRQTDLMLSQTIHRMGYRYSGSFVFAAPRDPGTIVDSASGLSYNEFISMIGPLKGNSGIRKKLDIEIHLRLPRLS
jgi:hypothetical protein